MVLHVQFSGVNGCRAREPAELRIGEGLGALQSGGVLGIVRDAEVAECLPVCASD